MMKTKEQCIEIIREACHKACPQLLEIGFGCEVETISSNEVIRGWITSLEPEGLFQNWDTTWGSFHPDALKIGSVKIIGKEPGLNHVLAAIAGTYSAIDAGEPYVVDAAGQIYDLRDQEYLSFLTKNQATWNLSHGLYQQELSVLTFLAELLEKKN